MMKIKCILKDVLTLFQEWHCEIRYIIKRLKSFLYKFQIWENRQQHFKSYKSKINLLQNTNKIKKISNLVY